MMRIYIFLIASIIGLLTGPPLRAADDIDFAHVSVVNSPRDLNTYPVTTHLTSVEFQGSGWKVEFDRRLGNDAWPDFTIPGWSGPIQYTLGMCLNRGGWQCSAVVQMWQHRNEEEGFAAAGDAAKIATDWFYDPQWGPLFNQQPVAGESVGIFVIAGDGRRILNAWPGARRERSDVRLVKWGQTQAFNSNEQPPIVNTPPVVTPQPEPPMQDPRFALLDARMRMLETTIDGLNDQIAELVAGQKRVDDYLASKPIPTGCQASFFGFGGKCSVQ